MNKNNPDSTDDKIKDYSSIRFDLSLQPRQKSRHPAVPDCSDAAPGAAEPQPPNEINFILLNDVRQTSEKSEENCRPSILLAEDNPVNQKSIAGFLESEGYQVDLANNGKEALEKIQAKLYNALLLDCEMPVLNGYQVIKSLRSDELKIRAENTKKLPVIALAVHLSAEDRAYLKSIGMSACITKPVRRDNLLALLREFLSKC